MSAAPAGFHPTQPPSAHTLSSNATTEEFPPMPPLSAQTIDVVAADPAGLERHIQYEEPHPVPPLSAQTIDVAASRRPSTDMMTTGEMVQIWPSAKTAAETAVLPNDQLGGRRQSDKMWASGGYGHDWPSISVSGEPIAASQSAPHFHTPEPSAKDLSEHSLQSLREHSLLDTQTVIAIDRNTKDKSISNVLDEYMEHAWHSIGMGTPSIIEESNQTRDVRPAQEAAHFSSTEAFSNPRIAPNKDGTTAATESRLRGKNVIGNIGAWPTPTSSVESNWAARDQAMRSVPPTRSMGLLNGEVGSWPSAAFSSSQVTLLSSSVLDPWSSGAYPRSIGCYTPGVSYSVPRFMSGAGILSTGTNGSPVNALTARNSLVETDVFPSIGQYDTTEHALPANAALASSSGAHAEFGFSRKYRYFALSSRY
jgi:hypothetical protein